MTSATNHGARCTAEQETTAAADARDEGEGDLRALASGAVSTRLQGTVASPGDNDSRDVGESHDALALRQNPELCVDITLHTSELGLFVYVDIYV